MIAGVKPGTEVVVLDGNKDAIDQITQILALRTNIDSIHIVSHGAPGSLQLGDGSLSLDDIECDRDSLQQWFSPPTDSKLHPEAEIGIHQIRTTCSPNNFGNPAPEGIHRDGTDFVGIFSVDRTNILGGKTHLYTARMEKPVFKKVLHPGELLLVNEDDFLHFTTPIKPESIGVGTRDVFVLTSPSLLTN